LEEWRTMQALDTLQAFNRQASTALENTLEVR